MSRSKNLLVIPGKYNSHDVKFNGAFVFYIDKDEIILRGIVDHFIQSTDNFHQRTVERSLYIEDYLYTKSKCLLRINLIGDLTGLKNVEIPCSKENLYPIRPKPSPIDPILDIIRRSDFV